MTVRCHPAAIGGHAIRGRVARRLGCATVFALTISLGAPHAFAAPVAVDVSKREDSRVLYNTLYHSSDGVAIDWTGDVATCNPGSVSPAYLTAVLARINYFRALAGVPSDITLTDDNNRLAQAAALAMSANKALDHKPPTTWKCYSADVAAGAASNLASGTTGPTAIDGLIKDGDELGHRRWLLYPPQLTMGSGNLPRTAQGDFPSTAANYVFGARRPELPPVRDGFVAWPPNGFVPYQLVPPRWSLSHNGADFSAATVTVTRGGMTVPVDIKVRAGAGGYGDPAIVWLINNSAESATWTKPAADEVYEVSVANVVVNGAMQTFNYRVSVFDPAVAGPDTVLAQVTGPDQVTPNVAATYNISSVPNATGYQWRSRKLTKLTLVDGADNALANWSAKVTWAPAVIDTALAGQPTFHLNARDLTDQSLTYVRTLQAGADSQLSWKSRLVNADGCTARVAVSTDAGASWSDLYTQVGVNESDFSLKTIELGAVAGKPLLLRISLTYNSGESVFTGASNGWYFDDVTFVNLRETAEPVVSAVIAGPTFDFTATEAAEYDLDAQPQFAGQFAGELGPSKRVLAVAAAPAPTPDPTPAPTPAPDPTPAPVPTLPVITTQPGAMFATSVGGTLTISVAATGTAALSFAWSRNGVELSDGANLSGATTKDLQLTNVLADQAGAYTVRVSSGNFSVISDTATLIVETPVIDAPPMPVTP